MNKRTVNQMLPLAYQVLKEEFPSEHIPKEFRGYISTFGAAITMGSLAAAVAFYSSEENGAQQDRHKLPMILLNVLKRYDTNVTEGNLFEYVVNSNERLGKENVLHAAIAVKLAMNLFYQDSPTK
ncbi:hypothetical protein GGG87_06190 [Streptococcus sp. zg-86]|uniref:Uncharacterized protein n=1 Tax=Streptococcus zhangguiae TaxID=2664091 RepID=A0A6I4RA68_9STRE|nr:MULTISPECIES: type III-B CRISPR module-associated protein Cmr5 [unclassified Streptococcus]MTB64580.1 hypothetical protein [Streptococcus sp. zg-86]MTB90890.1 hypothetical protein [Streptococcus sp. zg-36]MWV56686.1 hypothetical protein [Streptococcus sp. zg-70]QTH48644.1 hypothetical protein J5M87_04805 [Streptococcus sp. zg-86]